MRQFIADRILLACFIVAFSLIVVNMKEPDEESQPWVFDFVVYQAYGLTK